MTWRRSAAVGLAVEPCGLGRFHVRTSAERLGDAESATLRGVTSPNLPAASATLRMSPVRCRAGR